MSTFFNQQNNQNKQGYTDHLDFELPQNFQDAVSCMKYCPDTPIYQQLFGSPVQVLGLASWDGQICIYKTAIQGEQVQNQQLLSNNTGGPVLGIHWQTQTPGLIIAHSDNTIKKWDFNSNQIGTLGQHSQPVKDVFEFTFNNNTVLVSGGWDARVKFWTWTSPTQLNQIGEAYIGKPVHYMSVEFPLMVTAHSELHVHYWNLMKVFDPQPYFAPQGIVMSPLKHPTTSICCFSDGKGYAIGSIEGRCGIKYVDLQNDKVNLAEDFCFKCHKDETNSQFHKCYTVNAIAFNKKFGSFATFGQDGNVFIWNKDTRSRLKNSKPAPWPVTAGDFSQDATLLAYAFGYDYGKGLEETKTNQYPVKVYVRKIKQEEVYRVK